MATTRRAQASIELAVPAAVAFDFLADPTTAPLIDPSIVEYRPEPMPMSEGTRNTIRMRVWGLPVTAISEVTQWMPACLMVMESVRPVRPVRVRATHRFEPLSGSSCRYVWEIDVEPAGPFGAIASRLMRGFMQRNADAQNQRFKDEVERRHRLM